MDVEDDSVVPDAKAILADSWVSQFDGVSEGIVSVEGQFRIQPGTDILWKP